MAPEAPRETTSRTELMDFDVSLPSSFSSAGPKTLRPSVSNYVTLVASRDGTRAVAIMYFLDSGGGSMAEFISADQAAWFTATASAVNPNASYELSTPVSWLISVTYYTSSLFGLRLRTWVNVYCAPWSKQYL